MKQYTLFANEWDFSGIWVLQEGVMFPVLQGIAANLEWDAPANHLQCEDRKRASEQRHCDL